jgi:hypothetical protein
MMVLGLLWSQAKAAWMGRRAARAVTWEKAELRGTGDMGLEIRVAGGEGIRD